MSVKILGILLFVLASASTPSRQDDETVANVLDQFTLAGHPKVFLNVQLDDQSANKYGMSSSELKQCLELILVRNKIPLSEKHDWGNRDRNVITLELTERALGGNPVTYYDLSLTVTELAKISRNGKTTLVASYNDNSIFMAGRDAIQNQQRNWIQSRAEKFCFNYLKANPAK